MEIYIFLPQDVSDVRVAFHFPINMRGVSVSEGEKTFQTKDYNLGWST